jgi:hypothetical protein
MDGGLGETWCTILHRSCDLSPSHFTASKSTPNEHPTLLHLSTPTLPCSETKSRTQAHLFSSPSSGGYGGLVRKEKAEKASETAPSSCPGNLQPLGHASLAHNLVNRAQSCRSLCANNKLDVPRCFEPKNTCTSLPFMQSSKAQHQHTRPANNVAACWPHRLWEISNTYGHKTIPVVSRPSSSRCLLVLCF